MGACVSITNLTKRYGSFVAVDGISLDVPEGEVLGLLGVNGAGKSTTLYMLAGLVRPSSGVISFFGREQRRHFLEIARLTGFLVERPAFHDYMSVRENLALCARLDGRPANIDRALERVDLLSVAGKKARALSTGMRQRLGLAQAILFEPKLVILDEPTSGLDPEATREIISLLRQLTRETRITLVFSSHMLREVEELCDRVAIIDKGKLAACEQMEQLMSYDCARMDVLLDRPEEAARDLAREDWISAATAASGKVEVLLKDAPAHRLSSFLVQAGYQVNGMIPRRGTLQEYFMKVLHQ